MSLDARPPLRPTRRRPRARGLAAAVLLAGSVAWTGVEARDRARPPRATQGAPTAHRVDRAALMAIVRDLSAPALDGRRTGTAGAHRARALISSAFAALGLEPAGTSGYLQPFRFTDRRGDGALPPGGASAPPEIQAANVVGRIPGTRPEAPVFVVTAHFDHLGRRNGRMYPGADDNASGVAALIAVARYFTAHPPEHPLIVAALDAEEMGLRGAEHFVAHPPVPLDRIALNVNLDMVSRSARREVFVAGTHQTPALRPILEDVRRQSAVAVEFGHDRPNRRKGSAEDWTDLSDHGAFHRRGIPFVYFGVEDHADYHEPTDTADRIDPAFFGAVADTIVESIRALDAHFAVSPSSGRR